MHDWPVFDAPRLRHERWGKTAELMARLGLDHLLLTTFDAIRYTTDLRTLIIAEGFDWFAVVVGADGDCEAFVPWVDEVVADPDPLLPWVRALHPLPSWSPAAPHRGFWVRALAEVLGARGARRVGVDLLDAALLEGLRGEIPEVSFSPIATELYELRRRKDPDEIRLLAAASAVNSRAAEAALAAARPGALDHDVLAAAMVSLQRAGVEYLSHSLCNVRRGSGTWFAVGNELREGEAFFFDIGCYGAGGYASDMARVGFVGEPPPSIREAHRRLLEAHRVGEGLARPGVRASEIQAAVNGYLERQGLPTTPYSVGHGIGLRACELPTIHRADRMDRDETLAEGMVIALEPETAVEIDGRIVVLKVEDDYVVEADGLRRLTDAPYAGD